MGVAKTVMRSTDAILPCTLTTLGTCRINTQFAFRAICGRAQGTAITHNYFQEPSLMSEMTVTSINERAAEEYFKRGQEAETQGLSPRAIEFYERALNENPDHEMACFRLAVLYDRQADDAKAIELYERICTSPPVHINALMNLAFLYEDNTHYEA